MEGVVIQVSYTQKQNRPSHDIGHYSGTVRDVHKVATGTRFVLAHLRTDIDTHTQTNIDTVFSDYVLTIFYPYHTLGALVFVYRQDRAG